MEDISDLGIPDFEAFQLLNVCWQTFWTAFWRNSFIHELYLFIVGQNSLQEKLDAAAANLQKSAIDTISSMHSDDFLFPTDTSWHHRHKRFWRDFFIVFHWLTNTNNYFEISWKHRSRFDAHRRLQWRITAANDAFETRQQPSNFDGLARFGHKIQKAILKRYPPAYSRPNNAV